MRSAERMRLAMQLERPDRVPLMCQPSWGFVLTQVPGLDPVDLWHNREEAYPRAFCQISERFGFDGVLIPAVGLAPLDESTVMGVETGHPEGPLIRFLGGDSCTYCLNDLPRYQHMVPPEITIDELDPDDIPGTITFHPPSNRLRMYIREDPYGRVAEIHQARNITSGELSIHGSVYAPEDYLIDRLGVEAAFMAMLSHPDKCREILLRYALALCGHVSEQIEAGADAINFSAPWTGQNFIGLDMYESVIIPAQREIAMLCREKGVSCYCHTCGEIDDRLEMIIDTGFSGLECLDPPPLGNVKLEEAVRRIGDRAFIKGNIDPVNMLMNGTPEQVREDAIRRLEIGMKAKGFILSTACSIAPATPPENLEVLHEVVERYGYYS
ncbi:MAG: uroporphyrinogen decarboxylase family protein [Bacteroidota bacterium]